VRFAVPSHSDTILSQPNAQGEIMAADGPWAPLAAGSALGDYLFEARGPENPGLPLAQIRNVVLILEYQFTPRT
jgi:hypothetical protein